MAQALIKTLDDYRKAYYGPGGDRLWWIANTANGNPNWTWDEARRAYYTAQAVTVLTILTANAARRLSTDDLEYKVLRSFVVGSTIRDTRNDLLYRYLKSQV